MSHQEFIDLALRHLSEDKQIQIEQKSVVALHQFSKSIHNKTQEELIWIRLEVLIKYQDHLKDKNIGLLCLHMIEVIEDQINKLKD